MKPLTLTTPPSLSTLWGRPCWEFAGHCKAGSQTGVHFHLPLWHRASRRRRISESTGAGTTPPQRYNTWPDLEIWASAHAGTDGSLPVACPISLRFVQHVLHLARPSTWYSINKRKHNNKKTNHRAGRSEIIHTVSSIWYHPLLNWTEPNWTEADPIPQLSQPARRVEKERFCLSTWMSFCKSIDHLG